MKYEHNLGITGACFTLFTGEVSKGRRWYGWMWEHEEKTRSEGKEMQPSLSFVQALLALAKGPRIYMLNIVMTRFELMNEGRKDYMYEGRMDRRTNSNI